MADDASGYACFLMAWRFELVSCGRMRLIEQELQRTPVLSTDVRCQLRQKIPISIHVHLCTGRAVLKVRVLSVNACPFLPRRRMSRRARASTTLRHSGVHKRCKGSASEAQLCGPFAATCQVKFLDCWLLCVPACSLSNLHMCQAGTALMRAVQSKV